MQNVLFPGSFDPPTNGHLNIIQRASKLFDRIVIVIAANPEKQCLFSAHERHELISAMVAGLENVQVQIWEGLIVDFAAKIGSKIILRGVRALYDFEYEFELSVINRTLNPGVETVFLPTDQKYSVLRSSAIKEAALFGGDISRMVPANVEKALKAKIQGS